MRFIKRYYHYGAVLIALAGSVLVEAGLPTAPGQPVTDAPYFLYFLGLVAAAYVAALVAMTRSRAVAAWLRENNNLLAGALALLAGINFICSKVDVLPVLFFPSLDRIFAVFVNDRELLITCVLSSGALLVEGTVIGCALGLLCGILIGFNKRAAYWLNPFTKSIGPIPATAWSPLALSVLATSYDAAVFMIALAVWFPVTVMTSSGIQNTPQVYFEVADTLGAGHWYKIFRVGVPAALPDIFLGLFYATAGAFITLVTAEMFGAKTGIGWYLNTQKAMMLYANEYAGLIVLALLCNIIFKLVFVLRSHALSWQKGVIKW